MNGYVASARIERATTRLGAFVGGRSEEQAAGPVWSEPVAPETDDRTVVELSGANLGPFGERLQAAGERWAQLTFYLFDAESWR